MTKADLEIIAFSKRVNREGFIAYVEEGVLFRRAPDGNLLMVDEVACEAALGELDAGRAIVLTDGDTPLSIVEQVGGENIERKIVK